MIHTFGNKLFPLLICGDKLSYFWSSNSFLFFRFSPKNIHIQVKRVKRLELMRIEEKKAIEQMNIAEAVERLEMMESQDMD